MIRAGRETLAGTASPSLVLEWQRVLPAPAGLSDQGVMQSAALAAIARSTISAS
ncbi:hypothetical protein WOLCODRAFT_26799 [Wolfiporia cocos MD-104 SS10]|uniref:Uncharacterized protein n=1 Tax=Wolfiporia cocos (strain MD-104) TaxID=742152 RepID=A0A2H3JWZ7_WOLCO|nr:hypothetical protein WOLCODRAFT_26799 [Wolfiporia cocos MD-104 SS10]